MKLYLVRHADAVSEDVAGSDDVRWLSARGREAARGLARLLREQNVELDAVVSSPLPARCRRPSWWRVASTTWA